MGLGRIGGGTKLEMERQCLLNRGWMKIQVFLGKS